MPTDGSYKANWTERPNSGSIPKLRRETKANRLGRTVKDRHFGRRQRRQGFDHLFGNDLGRGGASGHADHGGVATPFRVNFAAVRDKVAWNSDLVANLAQTVGVGAIAG